VGIGCPEQDRAKGTGQRGRRLSSFSTDIEAPALRTVDIILVAVVSVAKFDPEAYFEV
jgi:hypothetical protein